MILSMSSQAADFLASALGGFAVGVFFDLFRVLRKALRHKTAVTTAQDGFFWITSTLLMFYLFLQINDGEMRFYLLLGAMLGTVLYFASLSRPLTKCLLAFFGGLKKGLQSAARCVKMKGEKLKIKRGQKDEKTG